MDIQKILIYVVLAVIYYGFKYLKKKGEKVAETESVKPKKAPYFETFRPDPNLPKPGNPKTIMDLLEEARKKESSQNYKEVSYSEARSQEGKGYESKGTEKVSIEEVNPYVSYKNLNASETEALSTSRFTEFDTAIRKPHPIRQLLRNKKKTREAFILGDILKRKI